MTRRPTPRQDRDLPRDQQFFAPGTFTRVYAPYVDPVLRVWVWPPMPSWAGQPRQRFADWREVKPFHDD